MFDVYIVNPVSGNGYALEMIEGLLAYVRSRRDVRGIRGTFAEANSRSRRVMEKLGMTYIEDVMLSKLDGSDTYPGKLYIRLYR